MGPECHTKPLFGCLVVRWKSCTASTPLQLPPANMVLSACRRVLPLAALALLLLVCLAPDGSRGNKLKLMLQKREAPAPAKTEVLVKENTAKEFLGSLKRQKRQLWDRTQPDVQQWYQQFLYLGFDEAKFEDDISYWTNLGRGGNEYYGGYYQHHYDEDAPIGPRNPHTFRHGASVNYDDY
ncbi:augurin isoform X1 [Natator depressus]|uniref:augurin isoform X1 n=2 Tax=Natator depressus TaxID=27790 RepID=UPI003EB87520